MFSTVNYCYTVRTSSYTGEKNSTVSSLYEAKIFTDRVNAQEKSLLETQLADEKKRIEDLKQDLETTSSEVQALRAQIAEVEKEKSELNQYYRYKISLINRIEKNKEELERMQAPTDTEELQRKVRQETYVSTNL